MAFHIVYQGDAPSGTDPYTWYPALDKNLFPPHTASGFWGAQRAISEAVAPQGTLTDVNVATAGQMDAALAAGSRRITLTADFDGYVYNDAGTISDIDLIIPVGRVWKNCSIGYAQDTPYQTQINRFRIRGSTVGSYGTGGQLHKMGFTFASGSSDIIVEGLDLTAPGGNNGPVVFSTQNHDDLTRVAIHNNKIHSGGWAILTTASDLVVCGNSMLTGSDTVAQDEAWGIRHYPRLNTIVFGNDIRSNTVRSSQIYSRFRIHPDADVTSAYLWCYGNTFVERVEGHVFESDSAAGHSAVDVGDVGTIWYLNNTVITSGSAPNFRFGDSEHARVESNTFQSDIITSSSNISSGGGGTTTCPDITKTPNTYQSLPGSDPSWGGPGDPSGLDWEI